jgi:hypothetical protein
MGRCPAAAAARDPQRRAATGRGRKRPEPLRRPLVESVWIDQIPMGKIDRHAMQLRSCALILEASLACRQLQSDQAEANG